MARMLTGRGRLGSILVAAALVGSLAVAAPIAGAAKKKKGKSAKVDITKPVNVGVPDRAAGGPFGLLTDSIVVGKKFKGLQIRDVNVTVQTTGSAANAATDLLAEVSSPNGSTSLLFIGLAGQSIGPLTLDDQSVAALLNGPPPCIIPSWLCSPYAGRARPGFIQIAAPLAVHNGGPARGTWTVRVFDSNNTNTSVLNQWRLEVVTGRPFKTK